MDINTTSIRSEIPGVIRVAWFHVYESRLAGQNQPVRILFDMSSEERNLINRAPFAQPVWAYYSVLPVFTAIGDSFVSLQSH